jgi:dipeptidyl-peptidase 4
VTSSRLSIGVAFRSLVLGAGMLAVSCGGQASEKRPSHPVLRELHASTQRVPKDEDTRVTIAPASASRVTFARMGKMVEPGWNVPRGAQHAPAVGSERIVTFLASETGDETMSLFAFDTSTGKSEVMLRAKDLGDAGGARSREEELRRERQRDRSEGITSHV